MDAVHAEMGAMEAAERLEAEEAKAKAARERDIAKEKEQSASRIQSSRGGSGDSPERDDPSTAPHSPIMVPSASTGGGDAEAFALDPSAVTGDDSDDTAHRGANSARLVVSLDFLDVTVKIGPRGLPQRLAPHHSQAEAAFAASDYCGALRLLEALETELLAASGGASSSSSCCGSTAGGCSSAIDSDFLAHLYVGTRLGPNCRPLPTPLLVNKALCYYRQRDFRQCLRLLMPMAGVPPSAGRKKQTLQQPSCPPFVCDPARATATGLVIAIRSAILLVDVHSVSTALSMLERIAGTASGLTGTKVTASSGNASPMATEMLHYRLMLRDLANYKASLPPPPLPLLSHLNSSAPSSVANSNAAAYVAPLAYIAAVCANAAFSDVGLELLRLECLAKVRPREAEEDIQSLLEVFPSCGALWARRAMLQLQEHEALESLAIAAQHLLRALALEGGSGGGGASSSFSGAENSTSRHRNLGGPNNSRTCNGSSAMSSDAAAMPRALLRGLRIVNGRLHAAQQWQAEQRWAEAYTAYLSIVDGICLREAGATDASPAAVQPAGKGVGRGSSFSAASSSSTQKQGQAQRFEDGLWAEVAEVFHTAAVLAPMRVELLCCQLKMGDAAGVAKECSDILAFLALQQQQSASSSSSASSGTTCGLGSATVLFPEKVARAKTFRIRPAILRSFRAQSYVTLGAYEKALADAKAVYAEAPSDGSREFIRYIEGHLGIHHSSSSSQQRQQGGRRRPASGHSGGGSGAGPSASILREAAEARRCAHCALLGLSAADAASSAAVSKAYKVAALRWHPDKWVAASPDERLAAEEHFKKLNEAHAALQEGAA